MIIYIPVSMISVLFVPNYSDKSRNDDTNTNEVHNNGEETQKVERELQIIEVVAGKFCKLITNRCIIHTDKFLV